MKAVEITKAGGPEVLQLCDRPMPVAGCGEVVIQVAYAGVNRPDALQRAGLYNPPATASDLPGLEAAGKVLALGDGVANLSIGDQVCALLPGGGYAEFVATPAAHCLPVPAGLTLKQAACLPETFFTVWSNVFMRGGLIGGERFLVHGGSSGIGTTAIQLARAFGARVFTTAGSDEKCAACLALGADQAINYRDEDFVEIIRAMGGADLILDMVGGSYMQRNIKALANDGRLVQIAFLQGPKAELNMIEVMTPIFKQDAWAYLHTYLLQQVSAEFWVHTVSGIDRVWCAKLEKRFPGRSTGCALLSTTLGNLNTHVIENHRLE